VLECSLMFTRAITLIRAALERWREWGHRVTAVRVVDVFEHRESDQVFGFTDVTLQGHAEKGWPRSSSREIRRTVTANDRRSSRVVVHVG